MVNRLLLLNGVAIVNVILFHSTGFGFTALFFWAHRYRPVTSPNFDEVGSAAYWVMRLIEQYVAFTIPAFLFVSGFFVSVLAGRGQSGVKGSVITARVRTLVIPYLFWSGVILAGMALEGRLYSTSEYARMILTGATNPNYYYVPLLIQMYVLAPLVVWTTRWRWQTVLIATAVVQFVVYALQYALVVGVEAPAVLAVARAIPKWLFVAHLFWFALGVVVGFEQRVFKPIVYRFRWHLLSAALVLFVVGFAEWEWLLARSGSPWSGNRMTVIDGLYAAAAILAFLGFAESRFPFSSTLMDLGGKSFAIYLIHGIVMEYAARGAYHAAPWVLARQWILLPFVIVLGLSVPLLLMNVVARTRARVLYPYLFG